MYRTELAAGLCSRHGETESTSGRMDYARLRVIGRYQVLTSSSDYRSRDREVLHSCQLTALHHCRRLRSHLRSSPLWNHVEPRPPHPSAPSSPGSPSPLDSSPARAVPVWFPSSSPARWCSPPFPSSRLLAANCSLFSEPI